MYAVFTVTNYSCIYIYIYVYVYIYSAIFIVLHVLLITYLSQNNCKMRSFPKLAQVEVQ